MSWLMSDRAQTAAFTIAVAAFLAAAATAALMPSPIADPTRIARVELPRPLVVRLPKATPPAPIRDENATTLEAGEALARDSNEVPPSGAQARAVLPQVDENGIIPLQFDLQAPGGGGERVEADAVVVRKTFTFGEQDIGSAQIHIDSQSRLLIDAAELGSLMASSGIDGPAALTNGGSGLRSFAELRRLGVDLRYDPARDRVTLSVS